MDACKLGLALLACLSAGTSIAAELPPPSIGVSPSRIELQLDRATTTGSATVLNLGNRPVHISASVVDFDLDEANRVRELPPEAGALAMAVVVNPVDFTIAAKSSQTIRFAVMRDRLSGAGEHRAMLFFSELVDTDEPTVKLNFRLGVPMYTRNGNVVETVVVHEIAFGETAGALQLDVSATGNVQVRPQGHYQWWPAGDYPGDAAAYRGLARLDNVDESARLETTGSLATKPVFPGTRRVVDARVEAPSRPGDHVLALRFSAGGQTFERTLQYESPEG